MTFFAPDIIYDIEDKTEERVKFLIENYITNHGLKDIIVLTTEDELTADTLRSKRLEIAVDFEDGQQTTKFNYGVAQVTISAITSRAIDPRGKDVKRLIGIARASFIGEIVEGILNGDGITVYSNSMRIRPSFKTRESDSEFRRNLPVSIPLYLEDG